VTPPTATNTTNTPATTDTPATPTTDKTTYPISTRNPNARDFRKDFPNLYPVCQHNATASATASDEKTINNRRKLLVDSSYIPKQGGELRSMSKAYTESDLSSIRPVIILGT
jgi:hypothetical protein